jgi:hypothetical protein
MVASLVVYFNIHEVRCVKLQYKGHCCEEVLPDFLLKNEFPTSVISLYKNTPLCMLHSFYLQLHESVCTVYYPDMSGNS